MKKFEKFDSLLDAKMKIYEGVFKSIESNPKVQPTGSQAPQQNSIIKTISGEPQAPDTANNQTQQTQQATSQASAQQGQPNIFDPKTFQTAAEYLKTHSANPEAVKILKTLMQAGSTAATIQPQTTV